MSKKIFIANLQFKNVNYDNCKASFDNQILTLQTNTFSVCQSITRNSKLCEEFTSFSLQIKPTPQSEPFFLRFENKKDFLQFLILIHKKIESIKNSFKQIEKTELEEINLKIKELQEKQKKIAS
eukprot:Anaeramoba_flamelloidesa1071189_23.p1 GENE.a1071189_23~~a1071189_23.p1  ORF type:complete len:135 (+),score=19.88 a1071189_23:34-405(+)